MQNGSRGNVTPERQCQRVDMLRVQDLGSTGRHVSKSLTSLAEIVDHASGKAHHIRVLMVSPGSSPQRTPVA